MTDTEALEQARALLVGRVDPMRLAAVQREIAAALKRAYADGMISAKIKEDKKTK